MQRLPPDSSVTHRWRTRPKRQRRERVVHGRGPLRSPGIADPPGDPGRHEGFAGAQTLAAFGSPRIREAHPPTPTGSCRSGLWTSVVTPHRPDRLGTVVQGFQFHRVDHPNNREWSAVLCKYRTVTARGRNTSSHRSSGPGGPQWRRIPTVRMHTRTHARDSVTQKHTCAYGT